MLLKLLFFGSIWIGISNCAIKAGSGIRRKINFGEQDSGEIQGEKDLLDHLLRDYNILQRPVKSYHDSLNLTFGISLINVIELNTYLGILVASMQLHMKWNDYNLKWNPEEYDGITQMYIPPHRIYKPDILQFNSADEQFDATYQTNVVIDFDGNATYFPPGIFRSSCSKDVTNYPYDEHNCEFRFGSWSTDSSKVDLQLDLESGVDLQNYIKNAEWELLGAPGRVTRVQKGGNLNSYVDVRFTLKFKRSGDSIFYSNSLALIYAILGIMLSLILSPSSLHRIFLGVCSFVYVVWLTNTLDGSLGNKKSSLVSFYERLSILAFSSIISNVFILYLYTRNPLINKIPSLVQKACCVSRANENLKGLNNWQHLAIVFDRIIFVVYFIACFGFALLFCFLFK